MGSSVGMVAKSAHCVCVCAKCVGLTPKVAGVFLLKPWTAPDLI